MHDRQSKVCELQCSVVGDEDIALEQPTCKRIWEEYMRGNTYSFQVTVNLMGRILEIQECSSVPSQTHNIQLVQIYYSVHHLCRNSLSKNFGRIVFFSLGAENT